MEIACEDDWQRDVQYDRLWSGWGVRSHMIRFPVVQIFTFVQAEAPVEERTPYSQCAEDFTPTYTHVYSIRCPGCRLTGRCVCP